MQAMKRIASRRAVEVGAGGAVAHFYLGTWPGLTAGRGSAVWPSASRVACYRCSSDGPRPWASCSRPCTFTGWPRATHEPMFIGPTGKTETGEFGFSAWIAPTTPVGSELARGRQSGTPAVGFTFTWSGSARRSEPIQTP